MGVLRLLTEGLLYSQGHDGCVATFDRVSCKKVELLDCQGHNGCVMTVDSRQCHAKRWSGYTVKVIISVS